jgi:peptide/nickel transport system substrate-binding protein
MKKRRVNKLIVMLMTAVMLLTACTEGDSKSPTTAEEQKASESKTSDNQKEPSGDTRLTDVGTPRNETLIVDILAGRIADPTSMNPYMPGSAAVNNGLHQLLYEFLWEIDTMKGEQFPELAATMPEPLDDTMTKFRFKVREGLTWSDGVPFTAKDVEFTSNMILNTTDFPYHGAYKAIVKSMTAVDDYTIEVETARPETRLAQRLGVVIYGNAFKVVPKHIWEKEDPTKYKNTNPIGIGPYILKDRDPQGYWFLWEKREDWKNSALGQIAGEPAPKYVLFKSYGPEEKRIIAAIQHDMDVLQDITPESWDILRNKNEYARAWYKNFPYATMDDPCERGIQFNVSKAPYDNVEVRWALALATDIKSVSMATFGGMLRVSPIQVPPIAVLQENYHKPMTGWLKNFEISGGYKPFEDAYAKDIVEVLKQQGIKDLPANDQLVDTFGVGWWKYDTEKASELLTKNGFTKKGDQWIKPDGKPWQISINAPANFEVQSMRLAFAVADSWKKFGIDAVVQQMDSATFGTSNSTGEFEVGSYWPACGLLPDTTVIMSGWHKQFVVENGKPAPGNTSRWSNDRVSELLDELGGMQSNDPRVIENITEINKEFVRELPFIPMFGTSKFVPVDTYYWEGFQTSENSFEGPWWWWSQFKYYLPHLKPTGR